MNVNTKEIPFKKGGSPEMSMIQENTNENLFENIQPSDRENPKYREKRSSQVIELKDDEKMNAIFQNVVYGEGAKENYTTFQFKRQEDIGEDENSAIRKVLVSFPHNQQGPAINRWIYLDKKTGAYCGIEEPREDPIDGPTEYPGAVQRRGPGEINFRKQYRFIHYSKRDKLYLLNGITGETMSFNSQTNKIILVDKETGKEFTGSKRDLSKNGEIDLSAYKLKVVEKEENI